MLRQSYCRQLSSLALALPLCTALPATSQVQTWDFRFEGFHYQVTTTDDYYEGFGHGYDFGGTFSGEDRDRDGVLELAELSSLFVRTPMTGCPTGEFTACSVSAFSYSPAGGLHFRASSVWLNPEVSFGATTSIVTGEYAYLSVGSPTYPHLDEMLRWTPQTRTIITQVPEPSGYLMMGAGLMLLGALRMRRRG